MITEVERDMRIFPVTRIKGKLSVPDFLEQIASSRPLLGTAMITESSFRNIENVALRGIKLCLEYRDLKDFGHLAILMTIIQYAKSWERTESSGFWAYICEQLGYKYSEQLYAILANSVKTACDQYCRVFIKDSNGDNSYYSTILAHAIAPSKSFFALCDFLIKFYKNNLDCSVYPEDPAIERMVDVLRDRCKGATIEKDEDIRGNVSGIQAGFRSLLTQRPIYMRIFLARLLQRIDALLSGEELGGKEYTDVLLTQWYAGKLTEPTVKRNASIHKRTTEIAFSYGKIRLSFVLDDNGEPALRIPSIRLANRENPAVTICAATTDVYRQTIGVYGNDYASTSEETIIPLSDLSDIDFEDICVELYVGKKQVFTSDKNFWSGALLFKDGKAVASKTVDEGNYVLFAPKSSVVKFDGGIERQRRSYFAQLYDFYIQGEAAVYVNNILLCCSRPPIGSLRFRLPQSDSYCVVDGVNYPIYSRDELSVAAVGLLRNANLIAEIQSGIALHINEGGDNVYQIEPPSENGQHTITLSDSGTGRVLDEVHLYIVNQFSVKFDEPYYLEDSEEGVLTLAIDDELFEIPLSGCGAKAKVPINEGEILVRIPRIRLLLDGQSLPQNAVWKGDISPASRLRVNCPDSLNVSMTVGGSSLIKTDALGGFEYAMGNAIQAYDGSEVTLAAELYIAGNRHHMFDIIFKPYLTAEPVFNLNGTTLTWLNSHSFIGDRETKLGFTFLPKNGAAIQTTIAQKERVLFTDFPERSERYTYKISAVSDTAFGENETPLTEGSVIFGNKYEVIFLGETLRITRVIEEGTYTEIKPVFIENISFIGKENLGYTDLSGEYAHYTGKLYFKTRTGIRYFSDLNPVDIYLVNDVSKRIHISFDGGAGLFVDKSSEYATELYKHTDPPPKLARYFSIPDYFEYKFSKEMY